MMIPKWEISIPYTWANGTNTGTRIKIAGVGSIKHPIMSRKMFMTSKKT
jgi:hypothetical protein